LIKIDDMSKGEIKSPKLWPEGQSKITRGRHS
jgi:hypothetical protein